MSLTAARHWSIITAVLGCLSCAALGADDLTVAIMPGRTVLSDIGLYEVKWQSYGQPAITMPTSWAGHFEDQTGISYSPQGRLLGREALLIHSPWRVPPGRTWVTYHLTLPEAKPLRLQFGIAMRPDVIAPGKSDGVTFSCQVGVDGQMQRLMREHYAKGEWKDFDFDLSAYVGKTVALELQVEPGPRNDASFDYSYFGDAAITAGDSSNQPAQRLASYLATHAYKATRSADARRLGNDPARGITPGNLLTYRNSITQSGDSWLLAYEADDCTLVYSYAPRTGTLDDITAQLDDGRPFAIAAFGGVIAADSSHSLMRGGKARSIRQTADGIEVVWQYGAADVTWTFGIVGKSLTIRATSQSPSIAGLDLGAAAADLRRPIPIPYLAGQAYYLPSQSAFACRYLDWTQSHASACPQGVARYDTRTDGARNPLNEVGYIAVSPDLGEVLPSIPHPPSPYRSELAGRIMLDVWGHNKGTYSGDAENLRTLKEWGVDHLAIITHQWQRYGYDVKLPDHIPADPTYGGEPGMKLLGETAKELGYLWSLHENYIDLYPDAPSYDPAARVLMADGKPSPAWFNEWTKVQSYGLKCNFAMRYAKANSPEIHQRYGTTAAYLDVHTCVPPWHQLDHDATQPMAAMALGKVQKDQRLFQFERDTHGGPLFGEGANQFYWAGLCDGVEAQVEGGESHMPLLDFDLLKIHPQMVNHGMGYYERWFASGSQTRWGVDVANMEQIDKYRAQEIAYGHAGFVGANSTANPWWVAREHHLAYPIQRLYSAAKVTGIEYDVNGVMVSASAALIAGDTRRQHISYDSGLHLWVNWRPEVWSVPAGDGRRFDLPQWGFLAIGPDTLVTTCVRDGHVIDFARCPEFMFADARTWVNLRDSTGSAADIEPRLRSFEYLGDDRVRVSYEWIVKEPITADMRCFVHGVDPQAKGPGNITFQQDHALPKPTSTWKAGDEIVDGPYDIRIPRAGASYDLRVGLFNQQIRLKLTGHDDGTARYTLATLRVKLADGKITGIAADRPEGPAPIPHRIDFGARVNPTGTWADFGALAADGAVKVERQKGRLILIPYPTDRTVNVKLDAAQLGIPAGGEVEVRALAPLTHSDLGAIPVRVDKGMLELSLDNRNAGRYVIQWNQ